MTTIAVTGASGQLGSATLRHLLARKVTPSTLHAIVRDPAKAASLAAQGVNVRSGDYTDAASLEAAFAGIDKLVFISTNVVGEERVLQHSNVVRAAADAGVGHIIYTSVVKPLDPALFVASPGHLRTETLIRESGIPYTFFRNNLYLDLIPFLFGGAIESGTLVYAGGDGRVGFVARDDIAEALAVSASSDGDQNRIYPITTSRPCYSIGEVAEAMSKVSGKPVRYESVTSDELAKVLTERKLPPPAIAMSVGLADAVRAGEFDLASKDLENLLGRAPIGLEAFLRKALAAA